MSRVWISMIVLAATAISAEEGGRAVQLPGAPPPVFASRAELVVAHVTARQEAQKDTGGTYVDTVDTDRSLRNHDDDQRVGPRRSASHADEE